MKIKAMIGWFYGLSSSKELVWNTGSNCTYAYALLTWILGDFDGFDILRSLNIIDNWRNLSKVLLGIRVWCSFSSGLVNLATCLKVLDTLVSKCLTYLSWGTWRACLNVLDVLIWRFLIYLTFLTYLALLMCLAVSKYMVNSFKQADSRLKIGDSSRIVLKER